MAWANLTLAGPLRDAMDAYNDAPVGVCHTRTPCGQPFAGDVDAAEQLRSLQPVKIERKSLAVVDDADRDVYDDQ